MSCCASSRGAGGVFLRIFPSRWVHGFAVGRSIFASVAEEWLAGRMDDAAAIDEMARNFRALVEAWQGVQAERKAAA